MVTGFGIFSYDTDILVFVCRVFGTDK